MTTATHPDGLARVRDAELFDLICDLEAALAVIEATERRARDHVRRDRLYEAAATVDVAIDYLRDLRFRTTTP